MNPPPSNFTHLEVHSHYSLLGATAPPAQLAARAAAQGMRRLALTDSWALYGVMAFAKACQEAGVQPILGMTVEVAPPGAANVGGGRPTGHLVLLATDPAGYRSLCRLSSLVQGSPQRQAAFQRGLSPQDLAAHAEGLICLSGGRRGWVERCLRAGDHRTALEFAEFLARVYGDRAYLSLEMQRPEDRAIAQGIVEVGNLIGVASVAVQPVYSLEAGEAPVLRLLAAIDHNCRLDALPETALPSEGDQAVALHWLTPDEIAARFAEFPQAVAAAGEVAERCGAALPQGGTVWPGLDLPGGVSAEPIVPTNGIRRAAPGGAAAEPIVPTNGIRRAAPGGAAAEQALAEKARAGLQTKYGAGAPPSVAARLEAELEAIARRGFSPLFLMVADIVAFAQRAEVPLSSRGSVANSLVAYCAGITNVDPVAHDLLFERFLNPARADLPDIDLDLCSRRRDEVLDYVRRAYGAERAALVGTMSTMRPKSAVRETGKAYGLSEAQIEKLTDMLPRDWHPDPRRRDRRTSEDVLAELHDERLRQVVRAAYGIVGQPHHLSVHPGGVIVTPGPLTDFVPVQWAPKGFLITQLDQRDLPALGLPKLDLLGVRALTVLADAAELVRRHHDPSFRLGAIPLDDQPTGDLLERGETIGVFQCESAGAQRTLRQLRARKVRDLAIANAFFKPGPSTGGMAQTFVRRYRGEEPVTDLHPALEPILRHTKGVLIFQEQVLRIAREVAGLSWEQADGLRRGMSKFRPQEMAELRSQFVQGCQRGGPDGPGLAPQQAGALWEQVMAFSGYGFNQGHATAYADVSYRSAYLKAHWPQAFLCARLADRGGFHHPAIYIAEAVRLGAVVRPPHVNHSGPSFTLTWEERSEGKVALLWMGLDQVRDLRRAAIQTILAERQREPFSTLGDLLARTGLSPKEAVNLIRCGALDGLGASRAALLAEFERLRLAGGARQMAFAFGETPTAPESPAQRLSWEREILGQPMSAHPLAAVREALPEHVPLLGLPQMAGQRVRVAGVRLPGWTGLEGFFLGDEGTFVVAKREGQPPPAWRPLLAEGRWLEDGLGAGWFQVERLDLL